MAQTRNSNFNPPSPRSSSGGTSSFKGTPDTRPTAYSLADSSSKSLVAKSLVSSVANATPSKFSVTDLMAMSPSEKDPFTASQSSCISNLSPTASIFNPFCGNAGSGLTNNPNLISVVLSTDLGLSRYLKVSRSNSLSATDVFAWLKEFEANGSVLHGTKVVSNLNGCVYLQFFDIRDAYSVYTSMRLAKTEWAVEYITRMPGRIEDQAQNDQVINQTAQISIFASTAPGSVVDTTWAVETAQLFLQSHGQLFAFVRRSTFSDGSFHAIAEFCDSSAVLPLLQNCRTTVAIEGLHLTLTTGDLEAARSMDLVHAFRDMAMSREYIDQPYQQLTRGASIRPGVSVDPSPHSYLSMYPFMLQPPLGSAVPYAFDPFLGANQASHMGVSGSAASMLSHYPVVGSIYQPPPSPPLTATNIYSPSKALVGLNRLDSRRQNAARVSRSSYHNSVGHHNHVDTDRIREGTDVRTTIMLRNIPNKVDQAMLKRIVDDSSWGKYDFMYLRIDFANDCNVGYAFINFVDPLDIIDFVEARGNQRWNCFKSDKVAEISYATIQGKDCLVQKFRNSSVMLESPHYRPKLFFTSNGPRPEFAGQEEPFPEPDNQSKMKRSCENAEHVGLFTPNSGQHFRDEQRRRRSQYDRGTRLAALEEYDYDTAMQHLYGGVQ